MTAISSNGTREPAYRWVIVAAGGALGCIAFGALFALPVFLAPMGDSTGWSRTGISLAMTIGFLAMAGFELMWGALTDRYGPRRIVLTGSVLLALGLFLAAQSPSLLVFQILFGGLIGCAVAAFYAPLMATVVSWFETRQGLAVSLVSAGMGMAPVTMSPLAALLITYYDWRTAYEVLALVVAVTTIPLAFLLRPAPSLSRAQSSAGEAAAAATRLLPDMTVRQALLSPQFIVIALTYFFCCATHSGPIFHTVSYAIACGIPAMTAVTIYSIEGVAGLGGQIGFGLLGDRFGAKNVLAAGLLVQAVGALGYFYANSIAEFYSVAVVFGFVYAGIMPLYAVLIRENFPVKMMGTVMGGASVGSSLGMATGPLLGGWIFDTTGNYGWLYIASFGMGFGALAIILLFRPAPRLPPTGDLASAASV